MAERKKKNRLYAMKLNEVSFVPSGMNQHAHVMLMKRKDDSEEVSKQTQTVDGVEHPASHFAYVPDREKASTWKLLIHDARHVGMAAAALGSGFRGQKVEIPSSDLPEVKARVRRAWRKFHPDADPEDMPAGIRKGLFEDSDIANGLEPALKEALEKAHEYAMSFAEVMREDALQARMWDLSHNFARSVVSILTDDTVEDQQARLMESLAQFNSVVMGMVNKTLMGEAVIDDEEEADMANKSAEGSDPTVEDLQKQLTEFKTELEGRDEKLEKLGKDLETAQAESEDLKKQLEEAKANSDGEGGGEEIDKSALPKEVRKQIEAIEKQNEEQKAAIAKMQDEAETREVVSKVRSDYDKLGADEDALVKALKDIRHNAPESMETIDKVLKAANEAMEQSLMVDKGADGGDDMDEQSAVVQLEKKAEEISKEEKITKEQAFVKALERFPELAKREVEERGKVASH